MNAHDELRKLPSVDEIIQAPFAVQWVQQYGRDIVVEAVREALEAWRDDILAGGVYDEEELAARVGGRLEVIVMPTLRPVINATGVILHTNLGRAPLSDAVLEAMHGAGSGYSNLEFDLDEGRRGSRYVHARELLRRLTGAEDALLVNNNAGAVLLILSALAKGREVVISRGELVEIGGGFRIPDVMAQSGARLVEVGTTNRTYLSDYAEAITEDTCALLRAHRSNFTIGGFSYQPSIADLVAFAREHGLLMLHDLGSGTFIDTGQFGLRHEPTVQESVEAGVDVLSFSGDKLLGGPQAGIIVGDADLMRRLRRHPLTRALRVDKTTIAGVQTNLLHYLKGEALSEIPIWRMISMEQEAIASRARALLDFLGRTGSQCELVPGRSMVGGGSLPQESLPTTLITLPAGDAVAQARSLRLGEPSIVARIVAERVVLDLRTVLPRQEEALAGRLRELL
ncbi:MAG: L-seryl-tRNA(Sec) selenium transferase [Chloroflexota bacterium]|nr:L-seryl-tRNA(Sec) selenium transferase [Chloroflexota bacterium]